MLCLVFQMVVFHFPGRSMVQLDLPNLEDMGPAIIVPIEVFHSLAASRILVKPQVGNSWCVLSPFNTCWLLLISTAEPLQRVVGAIEFQEACAPRTDHHICTSCISRFKRTSQCVSWGLRVSRGDYTCSGEGTTRFPARLAEQMGIRTALACRATT